MKTSKDLIPPHGGVLINKIIDIKDRDKFIKEAKTLPKVSLNRTSLSDLECIATGIYSPLQGFMDEQQYKTVLNEMRLPDGLPWSIPITLPTSVDFSEKINVGDRISLGWEDRIIAIMSVTSIYEPNRHDEAIKVYNTTDPKHPGVAVLYNSGEIYLGGPVFVFNNFPTTGFEQYRLTPRQTRVEFKRRKWRTVVAFQTRNPIHRAHEYLQKVALESVDGLFINPLVGATKNDDIPAEVRLKTYEIILNRYYPGDRFLLGLFPAPMRYAGPREAILHAIARKNYGCTHIIIGRDHAGVGNYYGTYDAQKIFDHFSPHELGIIPLKFEHAFYCKKCAQMATSKTCPHGREFRVFLSGTEVRRMLLQGVTPPPQYTRPEVAQVLLKSYYHRR
ncbi:MAG: sulfate adenylyltransferase [Candidatus Hodarchaeales archaeon]